MAIPRALRCPIHPSRGSARLQVPQSFRVCRSITKPPARRRPSPVLRSPLQNGDPPRVLGVPARDPRAPGQTSGLRKGRYRKRPPQRQTTTESRSKSLVFRKCKPFVLCCRQGDSV